MDAVVAELARSCVLMSRARALAAWVGPGRPVSARGVLRRGDVGAACVACGLDDPGRVRSAADVPALHRAWVVAEGAGLITVGLSEAVAATPPDDPLAQWLAGFGAQLRTESADEHRIGAAVVCRVVLGVLDAPPPEDLHSFAGAVEQALDRLPDRERSAGYRAFGRVTLGETMAAELLVECGAIVHPTMAVTPLGRWARDALGAPVAPASRWDDDDILQLKISLDQVRPPVWRRVQMPAGTSLGDLHRVNQVAFDWDGDHLHVFTVDEIHYSDPTYELMDCADEETTTLGSVLPRPGASIGYRYDLGDCWDHTVTLEKVLAPEPDRCYPTCTAGRGDAPVEDADPDDPLPPRPFHRDDINARFAPLDSPASTAQT